MEHSIDLAACHFIQDVAPSSTQKVIKKIKHALKDADIEDTVDLDALDAHLASASRDFDGNGDSEAEYGDEEIFDNFDIADAVGKALALVKQVCCHINKIFNVTHSFYSSDPCIAPGARILCQILRGC
jgi:hypothetical protein